MTSNGWVSHTLPDGTCVAIPTVNPWVVSVPTIITPILQPYHSRIAHCVCQRQGGTCYESLERLIGISHKHCNHGKINGGQKRHYPFRHPKWRYPYQERCELPDPPLVITPLSSLPPLFTTDPQPQQLS